MSDKDYIARLSDYSARSLAQLEKHDPEEQRIRNLYPEARYRAPHPIFYVMESLVGLGLSANAEEVLLEPTADEVAIYLRQNGKFERFSTLAKTFQEPLTDRFRDSAGLYNQQVRGHFHIRWQDKNFLMPVAFAPAEFGEKITFRFEPKAS